MEYCTGGELFAKISSVGQFTECDAAVLFQQMTNAVCYCAQKGICHKDLKPENFVFVSKEANSALKLIDFGLSQVFSTPGRHGLRAMCVGIGKVRMSAPVGTVLLLITQSLHSHIIRRPKSSKANMTKSATSGHSESSFTFLSAALLLSTVLTMQRSRNQCSDRSSSLIVTLVPKHSIVPIWDTVSKECKDLIKRMLRPADRRPSAEEVLKHEWFKIIDSKPSTGSLPLMLTDRLAKFRKYQKVKQAVLTYLATQLSEKEMLPLKMHFLELDKNGDGILSHEELKEGLKLVKAEVDMKELVDSLDTNDSGFIDYNGKF